MKNMIYWMGFLLPHLAIGQLKEKMVVTDEEVYYTGINLVAPFTSIRSDATSLYLPFLSNQETGLSVFIGKIWNTNYNVETRLSFGSPRSSYNLFQVHSGMNYCFNSSTRGWHPYAGVFIKLSHLHNEDTETNYINAITYVDAGNRFTWSKFFLDLRINQNIAALKWTNQPGSKAKSGFHTSIYKWESPYIPYASVNIGMFFR